MRSDIPKPDSQTNKGPMIVIVALFLLGYFGYMMFLPKQIEQMNKTENIEPVEQTVKDSI